MDIQSLLSAIGAQEYPPVDSWHPTHCGDMDMVIKRDGSWHYCGSPIGREKLVRLFARVLRNDGDDGYVLVTPHEKLGITVEECPFVITQVDIVSDSDGKNHIHMTSNVGDEIILGLHDARLWVEDAQDNPRPKVMVRNNLCALIARPVYYELVNHAFDHDGQLWIESAGQRYSLGAL